MTDARDPREPDAEPEPTDFDWGSPRWRQREDPSADDERRRRFRDDAAPRQRGAIDAEGSIPSASPEVSPEDV